MGTLITLTLLMSIPVPFFCTTQMRFLHRYMIAWKFGLQSTAIRENKIPIDIRATFREKWQGSDNRLERLHGTIYASIPSIDFGRIAQRVNLDHFLQDGSGQADIWLDFDSLRPIQLTADLSLHAVSLRWRPDDDPIQVDALQGRIRETLDGNNLVFSTQDLMV